MIENINEEKLQEIIQNVVLPNSNIGVHKMTGPYANDYEQAKIIYDKILEEGFKTRGGEKASHGIISHVAMCGLSDNNISKNILNWEFGNYIQESIKIIFAIPSIIESNGKKYYIGEYPEMGIGVDADSESIQYGKFVEKIPKEFILGHLKITHGPGNEKLFWTSKYDFVLNNNYIGLKSQEEQQQFFDNYESCLRSLHILTFDEIGYNFADRMSTARTQREQSNYYCQKYFEKYEELKNTKNR